METFRGVRGSMGISAKVFERIKVHFYKREACPPRRFAVALYTKVCLSRVTGLFRQCGLLLVLSEMHETLSINSKKFLIE